MNTKSLLVTLVIVPGFLFLNGDRGISLINEDRDPVGWWQKIDSLENAALYRSALNEVNLLQALAKSKQWFDHEIRAVVYQLRYMRQLNEDGEVVAIRHLDGLIPDHRPLMQALLLSYRAELYSSFFMRYRWNVSQNDEISDPHEHDIMKWSPENFFDHISTDYLNSLKEESLLGSESTSIFIGILQGEKSDTLFFPTLFDLLARRALDFHDPGFNFGIARERIRRLEISREILLRWWNLAGQRKDPAARLEPALRMIRFESEMMPPISRESSYKSSLVELLEEIETDTISARVSEKLAVFHLERARRFTINDADTLLYKRDMLDAQRYAAMGSRFNTRAGLACGNMLKEVQRPTLILAAEPDQIPGRNFPVSIEYRNINDLHLFLYKINGLVYHNQLAQLPPDSLTRHLLSLTPVKKWMLRLPDDGDLNPHRVNWMMDPVDEGFYLLVASDREAHRLGEASLVRCMPVQVTGMYLIKAESRNGSREFVFTDRVTGKPLTGISATIWRQEYRDGPNPVHYRKGRTVFQERDGSLRIDPVTGRDRTESSRPYRLQIQRKGMEDYFIQEIFYPGFDDNRAAVEVRLMLFTDRSIYQPGQRLLFRGILLDYQNDSVAVHRSERVEILLQDPKFQVIDRILLQTDSLGVLSGEFHIPGDRLTGSYRLVSRFGQHAVQVERYQRPSFLFTVDSDMNLYEPGDSIQVTGRVFTLSGEPVSGAVVEADIEESAGWRQKSQLERISTKTGRDGVFRLTWSFPDEDFIGEDPVGKSYPVTLRITDDLGETRYHTLRWYAGKREASIQTTLPEELVMTDSLIIPVALKAPDGRAISMPVRVRLGQLFETDLSVRDPFLPVPDRFLYTKEEWYDLSDGYSYRNEHDPSSRDVRQWLVDLKLEVDSAGFAVVSGNSIGSSGWYRIVIEAVDGRTSGRLIKNLYLVAAKRVRKDAVDRLLILKPEGGANQPKTEIGFLSPIKGHALTEVRGIKGVLSRQWIRTEKGLNRTVLQSGDEWQGGVSVSVMMVDQGRLQHRQLHLERAWENSLISVQGLEQIHDVKPGELQTLDLTLVNTKGSVANASVALVVYDASLDLLKAHHWNVPARPLHTGRRYWNPVSFQSIYADALRDPKLSWQPQYGFIPLDLNWFGYGSIGYRGYGEPVMMMAQTGTMKARSESVQEADMNKGGGIGDTMEDQAESPDERESLDRFELVTERISQRRLSLMETW